MARKELIKNGGFEAGAGAPSSWTGADIERGNVGSYGVGGGSNPNAGSVIELDGSNTAAPASVVQQTIAIGVAGTTATVSFDMALRPGISAESGQFYVDIVAPDGAVESILYRPTNATWSKQSFEHTFAQAGNYAIRFREDISTYRSGRTTVRRSDTLGSVIDNVSVIDCFTADTMIRTDRGERAARNIRAGDLVWTLDAGMQPVIWAGARTVPAAVLARDERLRPVVFEAGALGGGLPVRRMMVSRQHRIHLASSRCELYFAAAEVLVPALALVNGGTVRVAEAADVTYVHLMFADHHVVESDGALTESFLPTAAGLDGFDAAARDELLAIFPELERAEPMRPARRVLRGFEARLVA